MVVLLDPRKKLINLTIFYVEEQKTHGITVYHFIRSKQEFQGWKAKGYITREEFTRIKEENKDDADSGKIMLDDTKVIDALEAGFRRLTWGEQNSIYSKCIKNTMTEGKAFQVIDTIKFREAKLKTCLQKWNITDEDGRPIDCSPENIDKLVPEVADELLIQFEKLSEPSEGDLKN